MRARLAIFLCVALVSAGCKGNIESVPETPPPASAPTLPEGAALRPTYNLDGKTPSAGTAFVVADKAGRSYMLTAAHVMDNDAEWGRVQAVSLRVMGGSEVARAEGRPTYLGKAFDAGDATADLVVWPLAAGAKAPALKLAAADPKGNEWAWAVGQEPGSSGPQKAYRCKVTGTRMGGLLLQQHDRFVMRGFSGGPVVNAQGEVVGSLLGGNAPTVIISRVSGIRARLAQANVQLP
jgi:S1-C subfamily serine protease